ncbi:hypothetical protein PF005_g9185 [Phytophthora fragariae]|uniref:Uncharacterized protein n=1 Tax=Phytophthora fragariae TaxID=53985 RepID=A0A6A4DAG0_9STRA|nr:hypothetical protein PF003_g24917 [Phytophthora fragariae]KAE8940178.1 hypothetical protein PF009_g10006 [Phytophthora fragariae]KAE9002329.1 hypothetical protein PF011_g13364 [Phytophthora fragariae]KAE9115549.1 hypothetical protein PF007_g9985 [Phytophthora fragariae]KAE9116389.1 hypothetical protein PF010_g8983 [Phytophthora fragariae]
MKCVILRSIFQSLDARVLNSLIISHCSELVVTVDIRRFSKLMVLEMYNSTVTEWSSISSLSLPYFPFLTTLFFVRSQLKGGLPEGITSDLSPDIIDIEFVATDLGGPLPDDLDKKWPSVVMLYLEHCELQEFPSVLSNMGLTDLSLADNNISVVPDSLSDSSMYVMLDHNPLDSIPDSFGSLNQLVCLTTQYTNVATLPLWLSKSVDIKYRARGTPYCRDLQSDSPEAVFASCAMDDSSNGIFPLAMRDRDRSFRAD